MQRHLFTILCLGSLFCATSFAERILNFSEPYMERNVGDRLAASVSITAPISTANTGPQTVQVQLDMYDCATGVVCGPSAAGAHLSTANKTAILAPGQTTWVSVGGGSGGVGNGYIEGTITVTPSSGYVVAGGAISTVEDNGVFPYPNYIVNHTMVINGGKPF